MSFDESSSSSSSADTWGAGEIMLFGVRVKVDPMRKCVSMNNLSQYQQLPSNADAAICNNNNNTDANINVNVAADTGYATADDAAPLRNQSSNPTKDRKRGVPWTEDEHKLFLQGLAKVGKGDWRGISRNFVKTRTPTQVASHAQKYFLRKSNLNRRRRRSSLFDITTDSVTPMPVEEQVYEDNQGQKPIVEPSMPSSQLISGFPTTTFPMPVSSPVLQLQNQVQMITFNNNNQVTSASTQPRMDLNLNQKYETDVLPVSLNLSLSFDQNQSFQYQMVSGLKNGDNMISVN